MKATTLLPQAGTSRTSALSAAWRGAPRLGDYTFARAQDNDDAPLQLEQNDVQ
ncbi:hypothetical protein KPG66_00755 [Mycetohabitans sp. B2]|uniref:hypothetical protein n=1 Tax=Mycetohabitans TaxID=2571159 RepID=UPI001F246170|nr:hypothetical protein [Mycetohabitans sp. B2]MCF7694694.1 hypothetical protein [Mycetohabitans sp. B2]